MVARSITEELAIAVPAEVLWKAALATGDESSMRNFLTGMIDVDVKFDGDGGPGSRYTLKFKPAVGAAMVVIKSRLAALDNEARVIRWDEVAVEGGVAAAEQFKSLVVQYKVDPAGAGSSVAKITVEYERLDGMPLSLADQSTLMKIYADLSKKVEENIVTRPGEFA